MRHEGRLARRLMAESKRPKILLVEDEPTIASICARILAAEGLDVEIATDGETARNMASTSMYDMCLTDIRMPGTGGIALYRYLQQEHPALAERVVFTTGDILGGNTVDFLREVNRPVLAKPFTPAELRNVVHRTLSHVIGPVSQRLTMGASAPLPTSPRTPRYVAVGRLHQ